MLHTRACEILGIEHPIAQAGMARAYTNAALVAAVSAAGGLGVLGCLNRPPDEAVAEIHQILALTERPFGVNFVLHRLREDTFAACLAEHVPVFTFYSGDEADLRAAVARAHASGAVVIHQVTTAAQAEWAGAAGVEVLVAQGCEAGGHMGPVPLFSLLPAVVAVAGERPVLAAGGIVDGAGLAAALCLGASGAWMGTRFLATHESPTSAAHKRAILAAGPDATVASRVIDLIADVAWPAGIQVRAIRNALIERWLGHEDAIAGSRARIQAGIKRAREEGDTAEMDLLVGMGAGRIDALEPAGELVRRIAADAADILRAWGTRVS
ncbi:MAG TPA: nitronate monooxygenase [Ktedonobacterales bacterium]|jgi:NAD(P)H-dependent flavin oxidoreductase YrpB (nitropropane dioxygenase family)|nr:nitronate monooxygenase [Ktedonobacterales bacterium]